MHVFNEVLYTLLLLDGKMETGFVLVLSPCNVQLFFQTPLLTVGHMAPGASAAKSVLIVGSSSKGIQ